MSVDAPHRPAFSWPWDPTTLTALMADACTGWRGPALAALIALVAALPGLLALPALDGDESRSAQATAQMLETGDLVNVRFQQQAQRLEPAGVHWLQAAFVKLVSHVEDRDIRPYRLPSILGAMAAAAACAWGASAAFGSRAGTLAGGMLGGGLLLSGAAFMATTDAVLCGATTLAMAGLGRLYLAERGEPVTAGAYEKAALWIGLACGVLAKGFVAPMVVALTILALAIADRRARWIGRLGWGWGLIVALFIIGPWVFSVTVATDGGFWAAMLDGGVHVARKGLPGEHALLAPILTFPFGLILPAALVAGWRRRSEPGMRFALAWLVPSWLVFECMPANPFYAPLPLYGALAWLAAAASREPLGGLGRWTGAALGVGVGAGLAIGAIALALLYGAGSAFTLGLACLVAALALASAGIGAWQLLQGRTVQALVVAGGLGVIASMTGAGLLLPRLPALWVSQRAAQRLNDAGLDPRDGRTVGPVAVAGYAAPSLVFALGTDTELDHDGAEAADAVAAGSPAFVENHEDAAFRDAIAKRGAVAQVAGAIGGFDYATGREVSLTLWRPTLLPPAAQTDPSASEVEPPKVAAPPQTAAPTARPETTDAAPKDRSKETRR